MHRSTGLRLLALLAALCFALSAAPAASFALENSAYLAELTVTGGELSKEFQKDAYAYQVTPDVGKSAVSLVAEPEDSAASVAINGKPGTESSLSLDGAHKASIRVTSADGQLEKTYTVELTPRSNNADIGEIGHYNYGDVLTPNFGTDRYEYTVTPEYPNTACELTFSPDDKDAVLTVNGQDTDTITLDYAAGPKQAKVTIIAPDGVTKKTYIFTVSNISANADILYLGTVPEVGEIRPEFDPEVTSYKAIPVKGEGSVMFGFIPMDERSTVKIDGKMQRPVDEGVYVWTVGVEKGLSTTAKIEVTASDGKTKRTYTVTYVDTTKAPAAPSLTAKAQGYGSVGLSWNAVSGAQGYEVYRAASSKGPYTKIADISGTSFADSGLTSGKTYYYKARAYAMPYEAKVFGAYSSVKSAAPAWASLSLKVSSTHRSVRLSWNTVAEATGYEVQRASSSKGPYAAIARTTETSLTDTNAASGKTYYYRVRPYDDANGAAIYGPACTYKSAAPAWPSLTLRAAAAGYDRNQLSWNAVSGATGYEVYRAASSKGPYALLARATETSLTDAGLTTGKTYYYKVRPYDDANGAALYGPYASYKSATPAWPSLTLRAASAGYDRNQLSWNAVAGATGYEVYRASSSKGPYALLTRATGTSLTDAGLTTGKTYYYKVRPYDDANGAAIYGPACAYKSAVPAWSSLTLRAAAAGYDRNQLSWNAVTGATGYEVYRAASSKGPYALLARATGTSLTDVGLTTGKTYYYKVRPYDDANGAALYGPYASYKSAAPVPAAPALRAQKTSGTVTLSWDTVPGAARYEVYRATSAKGSFTKIADTAALSAQYAGSAGRTYYFKARAYVSIGKAKVYGPYCTVVTCK